jgi:hypothetical protein
MQFFIILNWFNVFAVPRAIIQNKEISSYNYKPITNHKSLKTAIKDNAIAIISNQTRYNCLES